jgi:hypothetical protein
LCSSEWPPLRRENDPVSKSDSGDESELPELEVDNGEYGYYDEWEDASHLLYIDMDGGPSGHPQSTELLCKQRLCASADYSDPESIAWSDSEDDGDQSWSDQEEEQDATHLIGSSR